MAKLTSGTPVQVENGVKSYAAKITAGTVTFSISIGGSDYIPITDGVISATGTGTMHLPDCLLKADFTNAEVHINSVRG